MIEKRKRNNEQKNYNNLHFSSVNLRHRSQTSQTVTRRL